MKPKATLRSFLALAGASVFAISSASAATRYWDGTDITADADGGAGVWNSSTASWDDAATGGASVTFTSNDTAVFGGTAGTVSMSTGFTAGGVQFDTTGYILSGGNPLTFGVAGNIVTNADATISCVLGGSVAINKTGLGMVTLTAVNTYTGVLTLSNGTLRATSNSTQAIGTGAATLTLAGGRLELANDSARAYNRNTTVTADSTISTQRLTAGTGNTHTLGTLSIGAQTLNLEGTVATSGTQGLTLGATTLSGTATFNVTNPGGGASTLLTLGATGGSGNGITKTGDGILNLSAANTYTGATAVNGGVLRLSNATALPGGIAATGGTSALTMNGGYIELANGNFNRDLGTGSDQFQITGGTSGFSANGATRIVNIGGASTSVTWGSSNFSPSTLVLNGTTANNSLDFQNAIDLGAGSRTVSVGANTAILSSAISNGGLTKAGSGILVLTNTSNSFAGGVTVSGGVLVVSADTNLGDSAGSITLNGGRFRVASGTTTLGGANLTTARDLIVNSGGGELQVAKNNNITITGKLTGPGTLTLIDNGGSGTPSTYSFNSTSNDFTGGIIANNAILNVARLDDSANNLVFNNSLGNTTIGGTAGLRYGSGATAALTFGASGRAIEFNGAVATGLLIQNNNTTYAITIAKDLVATGAGAKILWLDSASGPANVFSGAITDGTGGGTVGISKTGAGTWSLSNSANSFTGGITVSSTSTLKLGSISSTGGSIVLGTGSSITSTLEFIGDGDTTSRQVQVGPVSAASGNGVILNNGNGPLVFTATTFNLDDPTTGGSSGTRNLTLGGSYTDGINEIQGNILTNTGNPAARDIGIIKDGASTWKLSGANTYTKATTVNAGTLLVNGSTSASSAVTVNGGTLGGTGTIGGNVTVATDANIAPGASVGTLSIGGNLNVSAMAGGAGQLKYELGANTATSDQIAVTGTLTIGTGTLGFSDFAFTNAGGLQNGTYTLITATGGINVGDSLDGADLSGPIGVGGTGTLQITGNTMELVVTGVLGGSDYDTWGAPYGLSSGSENGDLDGDGLSNFEEYAFGLIPNSGASVNPISQQLDKTTGLFKYTRRATPGTTGVTYTYESSTTLSGAWSPLTPDSANSNSGSPIEEITVDVPDALLANPKLFIRVKASKP